LRRVGVGFVVFIIWIVHRALLYCTILYGMVLLLLLRIEVLLDLLVLMGAETREQMQSVSDVFEVVIII
jgi:hypothetical protein